MKFSPGTPVTYSALVGCLAELRIDAEAQYCTPYGSTSCFQVVLPSDTKGASAKLHNLLGLLRKAGLSVRGNVCGKVPSVLVREALPTPAPTTSHSPPSVRPSNGLEAARTVGGEFDAAKHRSEVALLLQMTARWRREGRRDADAIDAYERRALTLFAAKAHAAEARRPAEDVDLDACECGGDTAYKLTDFREFKTCRCCCSCSAPDSVAFDVHAVTDDDCDVEPHCATCAAMAHAVMLASGWAPGSFELRPIPPSDRALRLAKVAA